MSNLKTNFNVTPYYDDYDELKDFYRLIFRPRTPVQARELTQLQTILQKQIQRFGDHVFKDGSVVDGCKVSYNKKLKYVSVEDRFYANTAMPVSAIDDTYLLVGNTSGVRAVVSVATDGFEASFPESNRFYVKYIRTGDTYKEFQRDEYIKVYNSSQNKLDDLNSGNYVDQIKVLDRSSATGSGYGVTVSDGIIYHKGFFSRVEKQTVIVRDFDNDPAGYVVGFRTRESIVTEDQDESLLDNALGYANYNAPGAHRLKLIPTLVAKLKSEVNDTNGTFFAIVEFDNTAPTEQNTDAAYNVLGDEMARRTAEESGDYVVKPFTIETFPGIDANTNAANSNLLAYSLSTGIAYVKGYRVEKIGTSNVVVNRAFTTKAAEAQIVTANYGSYVVVNELMGHFDVNASAEVTLYDAAQATITDFEKASGARAGSIVGYANVKALQYYSGTKGTPSCQYLLYLDNIRMNSGKSFSQNVKSVYMTGTYGAARCDVVTQTKYYANGVSYQMAKLEESSLKTLVFPLGADATKTLLDNSGATDTQFIFTAVANATLQTNGFVSVALNPAAPGGSERVNASGTLTSLGEKAKFDLILTTDVVSANLSGTVVQNTSTANLNGSGTSFTSQFNAGEYVRIFYTAGGSFNDRRIVSVTNSTQMVLASAPSNGNAAASFAKLFPEGTHMDLSNTAASVNVTSNTTFTVTTGTSVSAAANVQVSYQVLKYNSYPMAKQVAKSRFVKINCNTGGTTGPWILGIPDVYAIEAVYYGTSFSESNPDKSDWFELDTGQRQSYYDLARLSVKPEYKGKISASTRLLVKLSHFTVDASQGVGYFCVDSYPTSNSSNSSTITWAEIPTFKSKGVLYDLRNVIDIRPYKANTANSATAAGDATTNPSAAANGFTSATLGYTFVPDSNFQADIQYYLPRRDVVVVNKNGDFSVVTGEPAENPVTPIVSDDVMVIGNAYVPAWPTLSAREARTYKRHDIKVRTEIKTNRRYTMRDIGTLDERIKRVEYYAVLNALEQKARDFTIPDTNGLDRFKNGIFADPFNSHALGKVDDFEYKIAVDNDESVARPFFVKHKIDFKYKSASSDTTKRGNYVMIPYTHEQAASQTFASKVRNCTELVWEWSGKLKLYPSYDDYVDEKAMPNFNVTLDMTSAWEDFASSIFGTVYGDWRTKKKDEDVIVKKKGDGTTTTTTTTTELEKLIKQLKVDTLTQKYDLGGFVKDIAIEPFMRSRLVGFVANNLKPNTVVHAFFDNVLVDEHCAPAENSGLTDIEEGREDKFLSRTGAFGSELRTDSSGIVRGIFRIPAETFRVGERTFALTDIEDLVVEEDAALTRADARFTASNITISTQGVSITTLEPELSVIQTIIDKTVTTTSTEFEKNPPRLIEIGDNGNDGGRDPIAQSFVVKTPSSESGAFYTKLDLYFKTKDPKLGVTVLIAETRLGLPDRTRIVGKSYLTSDEVNVSDDGQTKTTFVFDEPIFLSSGDTYVFMVKPDGNSPDYQIWLGEVGGFDVSTGEQIYSNPYSGVAYISANMNTWTPVQKEDIKFTLYRAKFTVGSYTALFKNEPDDFVTFQGLIRANSDNYVAVGDLIYTANASNTAQVFTANSDPSGIVQYIDEAGEKVYIDSSTGDWAASDVIVFHRPTAAGNTSLINANSLVATANILSIDNREYHAVVPRFSILKPSRTSYTVEYKGRKESLVQDSDWIKVINDREYEFLDTTRLAMSRTNEVNDISSNASCDFRVTLSTESQYVSPVIDLRRKSSYFIENIINNDSTGEANTRHGDALTKYVSKNVVLATGQESEDIRVMVSAHRPVNTSFKVYVKFQNGEDGETFNDKCWTLLESLDDEVVFSNPQNQKDFIEYSYGLPSSAPASNPTATYLDSNTGICTYTRTDGAVFNGYKTFCIKIVLLSSNPARVPLLNDVRAICLQA